MSGFPGQDEIDKHYGNKKKEVGKWLIEYTGNQKRLTQEQRKRILAYAERISFSTAGETNAYVQELKTVGKKSKDKLRSYLANVDWFPDGINHGVLDGLIVNRIVPNELDLLYERLEKEYYDKERKNRNSTRIDAKGRKV